MDFPVKSTTGDAFTAYMKGSGQCPIGIPGITPDCLVSFCLELAYRLVRRCRHEKLSGPLQLVHFTAERDLCTFLSIRHFPPMNFLVVTT